MTLRRLCLFAAVLLALPAGPVRAQEVRISGDDRSPAAQLAREILARGNYVRVDRDTTLPADFRAPGDLVIYDAEVRLEGTVEGSVAVIGGQLFIRPRSRVGGDIAVIGGDVYTSALATTGQILYPDPRSQVALAEDSAGGVAGEVRLTPPRPRRFVTFLPRPYPTYDRVNGLSAALGARFLLARTDSGPRVDAWVGYRQENPDHVGGGARVDLPVGTQSLRMVGEASRATRTNDAWILDDLSNSVTFGIRGNDYRDYYDADRASLMLTRPVGKPLIVGESWLSPRIGVQWERARSLQTQDVPTLFEGDDKDRENPPVLEGEIVSALAGADLRWQGRVSGFNGGVHLEYAIPGASDAEFAQVVGQGRYTTTAFRTHLVEVYFRGMMPVGGDDAPPQRFGILGGNGTLPTLGVADFRGDHLAFIHAVYAVPIHWIELPYLGIPSLEALYATGAAWTGDEMPEWVQNPGVGLAFRLARVRYYIDPATKKSRVTFSFSIPRF